MQRNSVKGLKAYDPGLLANYRYKVDANENGYDVPKTARKKILKAMEKVFFNRYPDPGADKLKGILAKKNSINPESIVIGNGSDELIHYLLQAFTDVNDKVVAPAPSFDMYRILALANAAAPVIVPLDEDFDIDVPAVMKAMKGAKFVFLAYPNNPTGNCFSRDKVLRIIKNADGFVVLDEAYFEFSGKTFLPLLKKHRNLIILRTFSKAFSLASMRVGYMMADPEVAGIINKVRLPYNVNAVSQACAAIMAETAIAPAVKKILSEREKLYCALKDDYAVVKSDANFLLIRVNDGENAKNSFEKNGISIRMFMDGRLKDFLRLTIGTPEENRAALAILKRGV